MYITIKTSTGMTIETNIENYKKKFLYCVLKCLLRNGYILYLYKYVVVLYSLSFFLYISQKKILKCKTI